MLYLLLTDFFLSELDYIWIFTFAFAINDGSMKISVFDFVSWPKKGITRPQYLISSFSENTFRGMLWKLWEQSFMF